MEPAPPLQVKSMLILHMAFFAGQVLFAILSSFLVFAGIFPPILDKYGPELILLAALLEVIAVLLARFLYRRNLRKINSTPAPLAQKLEAFRAANIVRWAILEGTALMVLVLFLLTNQWLILFIVLALLFIFFTARPTAPNIATDLQVSEQEIFSLPA